MSVLKFCVDWPAPSSCSDDSGARCSGSMQPELPAPPCEGNQRPDSTAELSSGQLSVSHISTSSLDEVREVRFIPLQDQACVLEAFHIHASVQRLRYIACRHLRSSQLQEADAVRPQWLSVVNEGYCLCTCAQGPACCTSEQVVGSADARLTGEPAWTGTVLDWLQQLLCQVGKDFCLARCCCCCFGRLARSTWFLSCEGAISMFSFNGPSVAQGTQRWVSVQAAPADHGGQAAAATGAPSAAVQQAGASGHAPSLATRSRHGAAAGIAAAVPGTAQCGSAYQQSAAAVPASSQANRHQGGSEPGRPVVSHTPTETAGMHAAALAAAAAAAAAADLGLTLSADACADPQGPLQPWQRLQSQEQARLLPFGQPQPSAGEPSPAAAQLELRKLAVEAGALLPDGREITELTPTERCDTFDDPHARVVCPVGRAQLPCKPDMSCSSAT